MTPLSLPLFFTFPFVFQGLGLLINLVEHCDHNRELLIDTEAVQPFDENAPTVKLTARAMESLEALAKVSIEKKSTRSTGIKKTSNWMTPIIFLCFIFNSTLILHGF